MTGCAGDDDLATPTGDSDASATSDDVEPAAAATLRLTSRGCTYDGPTHLPAGSEVATRLVNATEADAGFVLVTIPEGSTYDELARYVERQSEVIAGGERSVPPAPDVAVLCVDLPQLPPLEEQVHSFSFPHGTYAFVCLEQTTESPRRDLAIWLTEPIVARAA